MGARPSLRTELLFNLAFLAAAALLLGVGTVLLVAALAPDRALPFILTTVALDVVVFIFFGRYLVSRLVLRPVERLVAIADAVAAGDFAARAPLDPVAVLRGAHALLEAQGALKAVRADLEIAAGVPHILGRAYLLEQVIVNLVLNAVDAASGGLVVLGARPWAYEPGRAAPKRATDAGRTAFPRGYERRPARVEFAAGQAGALLLVADSGPGVAAEDRDKIFEPFYTTKEPGRGTGLGLAIVARAVHDMGGVVWVDPAREGGAAFKMFFPAAPHVPPLRNAERGSGGEV